MKTAGSMALLLLLVGLVGCATDPNRYYVPGDERGGDYYFAPPPRDDYDPYFYGGFGWGPPYGGYCPWGPFDCWSPYDNWFDFSFGYPHGPWWGNTPYYHSDPSPAHRDPSRERPREERPEPPRMERRDPRDPPAFPEPPARGRARAHSDGSPPPAA